MTGDDKTTIDILVVDDEPHIARALSFVLEKEGYRVGVSVDGEAALTVLASCTPKIVFLDLMMPKKSGDVVCKAIKADERLRCIHVVMLTCKGQELDKELCLSAGADEFLTKPFSPRDVVARVKAIIGNNG